MLKIAQARQRPKHLFTPSHDLRPAPNTCAPTRCLRTDSPPDCIHAATTPRPRAPAQNEPNFPLRTQRSALPSPPRATQRHTAPHPPRAGANRTQLPRITP